MEPTTRALFIGNSFTSRNDLPDLIAQLATAGNKGCVDHELISAGGASLRQHLNKGDALQRLQEASWDYVILQEQSTLPVKNASRMAENVRDFHKIVRQTGAKIVLYMTWARLKEPDSQDLISEAYSRIGEEIGCAVVPAGLAWRRCLQEHPGIALHDKDGSHPNLVGSYLAACAFYGTLFGVDEGIPAIELSLGADVVDQLNVVALTVSQSSKA